MALKVKGRRTTTADPVGSENQVHKAELVLLYFPPLSLYKPDSTEYDCVVLQQLELKSHVCAG